MTRTETSLESFLSALRRLNEHVHVDQETIDLLIAYARTRIETGGDLDFFPALNDKIPQALVDFLEKNDQIENDAKRFLAAYFLELRKKGIAPIWNSTHLAQTLGFSLSELRQLAMRANSQYFLFRIDKRNGKKREVQAPSRALKKCQRKILDEILRWVPLNAHAEGFRSKRSILTNASRHTDKKIVLKIDLKNFFPSISTGRVRGTFTSLGYPSEVVDLLTQLTTYRGKLPTGAPTSPAISNIICRRLDARLANLGKTMGFAYSRYADDMAFSSDNANFPKLIPFFREIVFSEGFTINESKLRVMRKGRKQTVTGIVVNKKENIDRRERKKLRAIIHNCKKNGFYVEAKKWAKENNVKNNDRYNNKRFKSSLLSKINYIKMVNYDAGEKLLKEFNSIV